MVDDSLIKGDIVFNAKPDAVPYNYRISYKVSQLCLIMRICGWGDSCSLIKLQMISYALFSSETMSHLINYAEGYGPAPIVRFDPAVNKALTFAIAYGFVSQQRKVSLEKGGNHPGIIIFDEPAQQSIVPKDMDNFIKSTTFLHTNCQVIMAITLNSHELIEIIDNLKPDTYQKINITGKAFQLLP